MIHRAPCQPAHLHNAYRISIRHASTEAGQWQILTNHPPPYPYGPSLRYQRANTGLYGGATIQFGNLISEKNEHKSRRVWIPNIHRKRLWSELLGRFLQVKINLRVLRTIDKVGGIDEYLIGSDSPARIKELGMVGWRLRWELMQTDAYKERAKREREVLGLPVEGWQAAQKAKIIRERKEGIAIAGEYLAIISAERKAAKEVATEFQSAEDEDVNPNFAVGAKSNSEQHKDRPAEEQAASSAATEAFARVEEQATKLNMTTSNLIRQAAMLYRNQTYQKAEHDNLLAERRALREKYASDIEEACTSNDRGRTLRLYRRYLKLRLDQVNAAREQQKLTLYTESELLELAPGPPKMVNLKDWERLKVMAAQEEVAWQRRAEARKEKEAKIASGEIVEPEARIPKRRKKASVWGRVQEVVFRTQMQRQK